jgi:carboxyl-terminal processing protease
MPRSANGLRKTSMLIIASAVGLALTAPSHAQETNNEIYKDLNALGDTINLIRKDYVVQPNDRKLIEGAISGALKAIDPHGVYYSPDDLRRTQGSNAGEFGGFGVEVTLKNGNIQVVTPIDGTPAARAGLRPGDMITHVDGEAIAGLTLNQAVGKMRGKIGTSARLTIVRQGRNKPFDIEIVRAKIRMQSVRHRAEDNVGYIRIASFNDFTAAAVKDAIQALTNGVKGFVIDLRNCPGGLLDDVVAVTDEFLDGGNIVSLRGRAKDSTATYRAKAGDLTGGKHLVVLINAGTASGGEIFAGALQDHRRAILVGTTTFGNGTVGTIIPVKGFGGAIRLTTSYYFTPSGRKIEKVGIVPDFMVEQDVQADIAKQDKMITVASGEKRSMASSFIPKNPLEDGQLQFALNKLRHFEQIPAELLRKPATAKPVPSNGVDGLRNLDNLQNLDKL